MPTFIKVNEDCNINILYIVSLCYNTKEDMTYVTLVNDEFCFSGREVFDMLLKELNTNRSKVLNEDVK